MDDGLGVAKLDGALSMLLFLVNPDGGDPATYPADKRFCIGTLGTIRTAMDLAANANLDDLQMSPCGDGE